MNYKVLSFYLLICGVVLGKVALTLYERSSTVHHGHQVSALQQTKSALIEHKSELSQQIAKQTAITDIHEQLQAAEYQAISSPIVITSQKQLASSQL